MLVLTRRKNQSIVIGDDIVVTVLEVKGDQIRLGITAPREVQVFREELLADGPVQRARPGDAAAPPEVTAPPADSAPSSSDARPAS